MLKNGLVSAVLCYWHSWKHTVINLCFSLCCLFVTSSITHTLSANYIRDWTPFVNGIWFMIWLSFDFYKRQKQFCTMTNCSSKNFQKVHSKLHGLSLQSSQWLALDCGVSIWIQKWSNEKMSLSFIRASNNQPFNAWDGGSSVTYIAILI